MHLWRPIHPHVHLSRPSQSQSQSRSQRIATVSKRALSGPTAGSRHPASARSADRSTPHRGRTSHELAGHGKHVGVLSRSPSRDRNTRAGCHAPPRKRRQGMPMPPRLRPSHPPSPSLLRGQTRQQKAGHLSQWHCIAGRFLAPAHAPPEGRHGLPQGRARDLVFQACSVRCALRIMAALDDGMAAASCTYQRMYTL